MKTKKRIIAILLMIAMAMSMFTVVGSAENDAVIRDNVTVNDALTEDQKALVTNYQTLLGAEDEYNAMITTDMEIVANDAENLNMAILVDTDKLTLATTGELGSTITWETSDESIIEADGTVHRPASGEGNAYVTLTATISYGDATQSKVFEDRLVMEEYTAYLLTYFGGAEYVTNNEDLYDTVHFAISYDGMNWVPLNENRTIVKATIKGAENPDWYGNNCPDKSWVRDPMVYREQDGSFRLLSTHGYSNPTIYVWDKGDLTNFTGERLLRIKSKNDDFSWAPEVVYDVKSGKNLIISSHPYADESNCWGTLTTDFTQADILEEEMDFYLLSKEKLNGMQAIDWSIINHDGKYYMAYSGAGAYQIYMASAETIGVDTFETVGGIQAKEPGWFAEGPFIIKDLNRERWYCYYDYTNNGGIFGCSYTDDLDSGVWTPMDFDEYSLPDGVRHGNAIPITQGELKKLIDTWGLSLESMDRPERMFAEVGTTVEQLNLPQTLHAVRADGEEYDFPVTWDTSTYRSEAGRYVITGSVAVDKSICNAEQYSTVTVTVNVGKGFKRIASYRFESDENGVIEDLSGNQNDAVIRDNVTVNDGVATLTGGYIEMPDGFADNLSGITVSGWYKRSEKQYNAMLFSMGQGQNKYLASSPLNAFGKACAIITGNGSSNQNLAAYGEFGGVVMNDETPLPAFAAGEWMYVTATFGNGLISLYADGELLTQAGTSYDLSVLNGSTDNYLGKSPFYPTDPNFLGSMACVDIYGEVLSAEEIRSEMEVTNTIRLIYEIGDVYSAGKIKAAREAYDALTEEQKALVTNYEILLDAEAECAAELTHTVKVNAVGTASLGDRVHAGQNGFATVDYKLYLEDGVTVTGLSYNGKEISNTEWKTGAVATDGSTTLTLGGRYYGSAQQSRLANHIVTGINNGLDASHGHYSKTTGAIENFTTTAVEITEDTFSGRLVREITMNHIGDNIITLALSDGTTKEINLVAEYEWVNVPTTATLGSKDTDAIAPSSSWRFATNLYSGGNVSARGAKFFDGDYAYDNYSATFTSPVTEYAADGSVFKSYDNGHIAIAWVNGVWLDFGEPTTFSGVRMHMKETGNCFLYEGEVYGTNDLDGEWTLLGTATSGGTRDMTINFGENVTYQYIRVVMPGYGGEPWNRLVELAVLAPGNYLTSSDAVAVDTSQGADAEFTFDIIEGEKIESFKNAENADVAYTFENGTLKIANAYLNTLANGEHTFTVKFTNGQSFTLTLNVYNYSKVGYVISNSGRGTDALVLTSTNGKEVSKITVDGVEVTPFKGSTVTFDAFTVSEDNKEITIPRYIFRKTVDLYSKIGLAEDAIATVPVVVTYVDGTTKTYTVTLSAAWVETPAVNGTFAADEVKPVAGEWKVRTSSAHNDGTHPKYAFVGALKNNGGQNWHTAYTYIQPYTLQDTNMDHFIDVDFGSNPPKFSGVRVTERVSGSTYEKITISGKNSDSDKWEVFYEGPAKAVAPNVNNLMFDKMFNYRYMRMQFDGSSSHVTVDTIRLIKCSASISMHKDAAKKSDNTAIMRFVAFIEELSENTTIESCGIYILPESAFSSEEGSYQNAQIVFTEFNKVPEAGDSFSADLDNIPERAFDTPITAVGFVGLSGGVYIYKTLTGADVTVNAIVGSKAN